MPKSEQIGKDGKGVPAHAFTRMGTHRIRGTDLSYIRTSNMLAISSDQGHLFQVTLHDEQDIQGRPLRVMKPAIRTKIDGEYHPHLFARELFQKAVRVFRPHRIVSSWQHGADTHTQFMKVLRAHGTPSSYSPDWLKCVAKTPTAQWGIDIGFHPVLSYLDERSAVLVHFEKKNV